MRRKRTLAAIVDHRWKDTRFQATGKGSIIVCSKQTGGNQCMENAVFVRIRQKRPMPDTVLRIADGIQRLFAQGWVVNAARLLLQESISGLDHLRFTADFSGKSIACPRHILVLGKYARNNDDVKERRKEQSHGTMINRGAQPPRLWGLCRPYGARDAVSCIIPRRLRTGLYRFVK